MRNKTTLKSGPDPHVITSETPLFGDRKARRPVHSRVGSLMEDVILVPMDFTKSSYDALDYALAMAKRLHWSIALVHIVTPRYGEGYAYPMSKERLRSIERRKAYGKLKTIAAGHRRVNLHIHPIIRDGLPESEIARIAKRLNARMIVLGRKERSPVSRIIFGSVTRDILDRAPCPVVVIKSDMRSKIAEMERSFAAN